MAAKIAHLLLALAFVPLFAAAHDPGLSSLTVDFATRDILVQMAFAPADLGANRSLDDTQLAARSLELRAAEGVLAATSAEVRRVGADDIEISLRYRRPVGEFVLRSPLLAALPLGHRQAMTFRDASGVITRTEVLSAEHDSVTLPGITPVARTLQSSPRPRLPIAVPIAIIAAFALASIWLARRPLT